MIKFPTFLFRKGIPVMGTDKQGIGRVPVQVARELVKTKHAEILHNHPSVIGLRHIGNKTVSLGRVVSTSPLKNLIHTAGLFASKNSRDAVLNSVLFKIEGHTLCVMATDLESHFVGRLASGGKYSFTHEGGTNAVCINVRHFSKILSSQNDNFNLHIIKGKDNPVLRIGEFFVEGEDAGGFPEMQIPRKADKGYECAIEDIEKKLVFVSRAVSTSKYKAGLSGIYFDIARQQLAGADGHRLHLTPMNGPVKNPQVQNAVEGVIVPASILKAVRLLPGVGRIVIDSECQYVNFTLNVPGCNDCMVTLRTVDGQFPKYAEVIPKECASRFLARTRDLLPVLNKAIIANTTDSDAKPVITEFTHGQMTVTVNVRGRVVYRGVVQGQYSDVSYRSVINGVFLLDVLQTMPGDSIEILLQSGKDQAWTIKGLNGFCAVIMPIELKNS